MAVSDSYHHSDYSVRVSQLLIAQVRIENKPPREHYVEQWEIIAALNVTNERIACYIKFKLMTDLRRTDILSLQLP